MTAIREALAVSRDVMRAKKRAPLHAAALAELEALEAVAEAARARRCNRFDRIPCSDRPEIDPADWCAMCAALARLAAVQDGLPNECDETCRRHQPDCDGECRHLPGHVNECNQKWARARRAAVQDGQTEPGGGRRDYETPRVDKPAQVGTPGSVCPCRVHGDPDGDCGEECG